MKITNLRARFEWKLADLWIGLFWKVEPIRLPCQSAGGPAHVVSLVDVWVCLLPCMPFHVSWEMQ